jgi:hypothetical protein
MLTVVPVKLVDSSTPLNQWTIVPSNLWTVVPIQLVDSSTPSNLWTVVPIQPMITVDSSTQYPFNL